MTVQSALANDEQADLTFKALTGINEALNIPKGTISNTLADFNRASAIFLSESIVPEPVKLKKNQFFLANFFSSWFKQEQPKTNLTQEFNFPKENIIKDKIFPFFSFNPCIQNYIKEHASQNGFLNAAGFEIATRLLAANININIQDKKYEFRKEPDGSVIVTKSVILPKEIMYLDTNIEEKGKTPIAVATLVTRIRAEGNKISHTAEDFEIIPVNKKLFNKIIQKPKVIDKPSLKDLKLYILGTNAYVNRQSAIAMSGNAIAIQSLYKTINNIKAISATAKAEIITTIAANSKTPAVILLDIVKTNKKYDALVAAHTQADAITLDILARRTTGVVRTLVASNPNAAAATLHYVAKNTSTIATLQALIKHPNVDEVTLIAIIENKRIDKDTLKQALSHPKSSAVILPVFNEIMQYNSVSSKNNNIVSNVKAVVVTTDKAISNFDKSKLNNHRLSAFILSYKNKLKVGDNTVGDNSIKFKHSHK